MRIFMKEKIKNISKNRLCVISMHYIKMYVEIKCRDSTFNEFNEVTIR
jgi:hypothetical protein